MYIYINVFDSDFTCANTLGIGYATCVLSGFRRFFSCVLTVGISQTKSMSTKNPKLGKNTFSIQDTVQRSSTYVYRCFFEP